MWLHFGLHQIKVYPWSQFELQFSLASPTTNGLDCACLSIWFLDPLGAVEGKGVNKGVSAFWASPNHGVSLIAVWVTVLLTSQIRRSSGIARWKLDFSRVDRVKLKTHKNTSCMLGSPAIEKVAHKWFVSRLKLVFLTKMGTSNRPCPSGPYSKRTRSSR